MDGNVVKINEDIYQDNVVDFEEKRKRKKGIEIKYCKRKNENDPLVPKKTPCNTKRNRDNVYPFKEEDIPRMIVYFQRKIDNSPNKDDELVNRRNLAMFIMGINIGLRASDLLSLKWSDIYNDQWNFLDGKKIKPIKTQRTNKHVLLKYNESFRKAIDEYRQYFKPTNINSYIFESREKDSKKSSEKKHEYIEPQTAGKTIKNAAKEIGISYNINSHSMRKTFARAIYDHSPNKEEALIGIGVIFGHSSLKITRDYLCITEEEIDRLYNRINLGYEVIEE